MTPSNSIELADEITLLQRQLDSLKAQPVAIQQLQDAIAAKRAELVEIQRLEFAVASEHQHAQEQASFAEVEEDVRKADTLCLALRSELHGLEAETPAAAEFRRNECLRARGKIRAQLGVN